MTIFVNPLEVFDQVLKTKYVVLIKNCNPIWLPSLPSAPPPYVHNQPNSMGMINIPLQ
jgi:hypothetical protein